MNNTGYYRMQSKETRTTTSIEYVVTPVAAATVATTVAHLGGTMPLVAIYSQTSCNEK